MILECSQCGTRYSVPDSAIGPDGRTVRCASCKHSWFQSPPMLDLTMPAEIDRAADEAVPAPSEPEAPVAARVYEDTAPAEAPKPAPDYDPFMQQPSSRRRRKPARRWTAAAAIAAISMLLGAGAILYSGAPSLAAQFGLGIGGQVDTPLLFTDKSVELRTLPNGSEVLAISGKVMNPTGGAQHVPDIRVELRDDGDRLVYSWRITPQARSLGPKAAIDFDGATVDMPPNAKVVQLSFATESGS